MHAPCWLAWLENRRATWSGMANWDRCPARRPECASCRTVTYLYASFAGAGLRGGSHVGAAACLGGRARPREPPRRAPYLNASGHRRPLASGIESIPPSTRQHRTLGPRPYSRIAGVRPPSRVPDAFVRSREVKRLVDLTPFGAATPTGPGPRLPMGPVIFGTGELLPASRTSPLRELAQLWLDDSVPRSRNGVRRRPRIRNRFMPRSSWSGLRGPPQKWLIHYRRTPRCAVRRRLQAVYFRSSTTRPAPGERLDPGT